MHVKEIKDLFQIQKVYNSDFKIPVIIHEFVEPENATDIRTLGITVRTITPETNLVNNVKDCIKQLEKYAISGITTEILINRSLEKNKNVLLSEFLSKHVRYICDKMLRMSRMNKPDTILIGDFDLFNVLNNSSMINIFGFKNVLFSEHLNENYTILYDKDTSDHESTFKILQLNNINMLAPTVTDYKTRIGLIKIVNKRKILQNKLYKIKNY